MGKTLNQTIILGGGCFWCVEAALQDLPGVLKVTSGYAGGTTLNPTYEEVCSGRTGHAEVIQVEYDPDKISLEKILEVFFVVHDPTTLNRQGNDVGTQYRSIIFYTNEEQRAIAQKVINEIQKQFKDPLVTELKALETFYPAEDYHRNYYKDNSFKPYCQFVIRPKLEKVEKLID